MPSLGFFFDQENGVKGTALQIPLVINMKETKYFSTPKKKKRSHNSKKIFKMITLAYLVN